MSLQSFLFSGDSKLEAAAVSDPAHITPGARGEHVRKIQLALIKLDGALISADAVYGPATAAAVLAYKRKRNIINRAYQTQADNIVGKMTIAALDMEMLAAERKPIVLQPILPVPRPSSAPRRGGPLLAFAVTGTDPQGQPPVLPSDAPGAPGEVILAPGGMGKMLLLLASGGKLIRTQNGSNAFQVVKVFGSKSADKDKDEIEIKQDQTTIDYQGLRCGETTFQAIVESPSKRSAAVHVLVLVGSAGAVQAAKGDTSTTPAAALKKGLVSAASNPLNPLPGKKINIFGEQETKDFEDYSTDLNHCSVGAENLGGTIVDRPYTADPRRPPGLGSKSVKNICMRSAPMKDITVAEIIRIADSGCRVTYGTPDKSQVDKLRSNTVGKGLATVVEEGRDDAGRHVIVIEFN